MLKICPNCGNEFNGRNDSICCCEKCYQAYYYKIHKKEKKIYTKICARCGKEFQTTTKIKKYCSEQCLYNRKGTDFEKLCPICGNYFTTNRKEQIYCCKKCKDERVNHDHYKRPTYELTCVICGKKMYSSIKTKKYCSEECKYEHDKIRLRDISKKYYHKKKLEMNI